MKKTIDIQSIENSCPIFELLSNWIPRKIIIEINKERHNNFKNYCVVIGFEIYSYIIDSHLFLRPSTNYIKTNTGIEYVGSLCGMDVYVERYGYLNGNEIDFFNETKDYLKSIRYIFREKKLKRILHEVI